MLSVVTFVAGFAAGWAVRSTVDSSRDVAVRAVSAFYGVAERARRVVAMEREHLEDLVAEGRARFDSARARRERKSGPRSADMPQRDRAA